MTFTSEVEIDEPEKGNTKKKSANDDMETMKTCCYVKAGTVRGISN